MSNLANFQIPTKLFRKCIKNNKKLNTIIEQEEKQFNKDKNYAFILSYQRGSGVLLANDSLDITKPVLEGLNNKK